MPLLIVSTINASKWLTTTMAKFAIMSAHAITIIIDTIISEFFAKNFRFVTKIFT